MIVSRCLNKHFANPDTEREVLEPTGKVEYHTAKMRHRPLRKSFAKTPTMSDQGDGGCVRSQTVGQQPGSIVLKPARKHQSA